MALLSDVRTFLQRIQERRIELLPDPSFVDLRALRGEIIAVAASERSPLDHHLLTRGDELVTDLALELQVKVGVTDPSRFLPLFLAGWRVLLNDEIHVDQKRENPDLERLGRAEQLLVHWAARTVFQAWHDRGEARSPAPWRYALELGLARATRGRLGLTSSGEILLRLVGSDAIRWVVALEVLSSLDQDDAWRGHPTLVDALLTGAPMEVYDHECAYGEPWPWGNSALRRWRALGLVRIDKFREEEDIGDGELILLDHGERLALTALGEVVLREVAADHDTPLKSLARATLEDGANAIIDTVPLASSGRSSASVVRHTRMVAHELRNALVPVRFNFRKLWERLPPDDLRVALSPYHDKILSGLDRALTFVTEAAKAVRAVDDTSTFELAGALRDAVASVEASEGASVELAAPAEAASMPLVGPRPRLVLALVNLLRNAVQAGGPGVRIRVTLGAAEGHQALVTVDDGGPGVPEPERPRLFTNGHTTSKDGSGHGLALVREVVEDEFAGAVSLDPAASPLGGARFILRFPLPGVL